MGKKRFSSEFNTLFDASTDEPQRGSAAVATLDASLLNDVEMGVKTVVRRAATKNFTSDLDALFNEAFTEAVEEKVEKLRRESGIEDPFGTARSSNKKPLSGLDALIRQTVDTSLAGLEHAAVKRLTIMFENQKIERLKSIAKQERAFIKDLVGNVLTEFIENYEKKLSRQ